MALFQQQNTSNGARGADTAIGAHVKISGTLSSDGDVQFDGLLEKGEMNIKGCLTVGTTAKVTAQVKAEQLVVHGSIEGNVNTKGDVEIGSSGKVHGDINAGGNLVIHPGGVFVGKSMMSDVTAEAGEQEEAESEEKEEEEAASSRRRE